MGLKPITSGSKGDEDWTGPVLEGDETISPEVGKEIHFRGAIAFYLRVYISDSGDGSGFTSASYTAKLHFSDGYIHEFNMSSSSAYNGSGNSSQHEYDGLLSLFEIHDSLGIEKIEVTETDLDEGSGTIEVRWGQI